jgi:hypothetical protein
MFTQLLALARNALAESVRQPFYTTWLLVVALLIVINPYLAGYTFDDDDKLASDMGLSMLLVGGLVLAAFAASGVIGREIENHTALTVVSKPLPRPLFVLGKYLGVAAAIGLAWWVWAMLHTLALRQGAFSTVSTPWDGPVLTFGSLAIVAATVIASVSNYLLGRHFGATYARWLAILLPIAVLVAAPLDARFRLQSTGDMFDWTHWLAMFFTLQAGLLFAAIATACSTRLGQVATLVVLLSIFLLGLSSDQILGGPAEAGAAWARPLYAAVPNLQYLWLGDALTQETAYAIDLRYVAMITLYTLSLIVGVLGLAVALFQTRRTV